MSFFRDEALLLHLDILKSKVKRASVEELKNSLNSKLKKNIAKYPNSEVDLKSLENFYEDLSKKSGIGVE